MNRTVGVCFSPHCSAEQESSSSSSNSKPNLDSISRCLPRVARAGGRSRVDRPVCPLDRPVSPRMGVDRPVCPLHRQNGLSTDVAGAPEQVAPVRAPLALGLTPTPPTGHACPMTTTDATTADLALSELHEHLAAIERLARAPFNADRIALHRGLALECLDAIAHALAA